MMALAKQATHATFLKESGEFPCCNKPIEHQKLLKDVGAKKQRAPATLSHGAALASLA
jgi:BarA-like signal transduction histidine kinase